MSNNHGGEKRPRLSSLDENPMEQQVQVPNYPEIPKHASNFERSDTRKRKADPETSVDQQVPSICSTGSSTNYSFERRNTDDDSEATSSPTTAESGNEDEEEIKPVFSAKRRSIHADSERKRRENINKKLRALQALIPNSDKVDKASMLDNAIEYLKSLQLQLQLQQLMTTMGSRLCMPLCPMMLPPTISLGMQQIQAANMIGMRMPVGFGYCQFPNPAMLSLFAGRMPPPYVPLIGGSSALPMPCDSGSPSILDLMSINNNHT